MSQALTEEEFKGWLLHPATKALQKALERRREAFKDRWASGAFTDMSQYGTAILNAKAIGSCEEIEWTLSLEFDDLVTE